MSHSIIAKQQRLTSLKRLASRWNLWGEHIDTLELGVRAYNLLGQYGTVSDALNRSSAEIWFKSVYADMRHALMDCWERKNP